MPESWWNMKHCSVPDSDCQSWIPLKGCQSNPISLGSGGSWKRPSEHLKSRRWCFIFTDGGDKTRTTEIKMTKGRSREMTEREGEKKQQVVIHSGAGQTVPHCWMCYLCLLRRQGRDPGQMWTGYRGNGPAGAQMHIHATCALPTSTHPQVIYRASERSRWEPVPCSTQRPLS